MSARDDESPFEEPAMEELDMGGGPEVAAAWALVVVLLTIYLVAAVLG